MTRCPQCGNGEKHEPIMSSDGDKLYSRLLEIIGQKGGETKVPVICDGCGFEYIIESFYFPGGGL